MGPLVEEPYDVLCSEGLCEPAREVAGGTLWSAEAPACVSLVEVPEALGTDLRAPSLVPLLELFTLSW